MWSSVEVVGEKGVVPCTRAKHSATLVGGHVYVLGGRGAGGTLPLRDFWRYSLASGSWERLECLGEPPPSLQEHSATAHEGRLYVFGGEAGALTNETPLWIYDIETQLWRKLPGQSTYQSSVRRREARDRDGSGVGPRGRRGHSAHALKDCLLIYGGYKDLRGSTNELWAFHYESESWQQVRTRGAGPARHRHAAALHRARLYVHAGRCDLRPAADLWTYDTMSREWRQVRGGKGAPAPAARSGHAAARAGAHLYIFGGDSQARATNDMWRFHFEAETWERIAPSTVWPSPRVDACALLVPRAPPRSTPAAPAPEPVPAPPRADTTHSILREISKLSAFTIRRAARCSYSALAGGGGPGGAVADGDSTESLVRQEAALAKSHSAYVIRARVPHSPPPGAAPALPAPPARLSREPLSVPELGDVAPAAPTELVFLDSEEEEALGRCGREGRGGRGGRGVPKSASVRFAGSEDGELSTSDYCSAERVSRAGFSNPHYLGPDVRALGALGAALTPDSGVAPGDVELRELGPRRAPSQLHLLLVGGREPPHAARLQSPLSMWTYRLL